MSKVYGVILSAGTAYKVRHLAGPEYPNPFAVQKCRLPVGGVPIVKNIMREFHSVGVENVLINYSGRADSLFHYLKDWEGKGIHCRYYEEPKLLGTAGGIKRMVLEAGVRPEDIILVYCGDILTNLPVKSLVKAHEESRSLATISTLVIPPEYIWKFSSLILEGMKDIRNPGQDFSYFEGKNREYFSGNEYGIRRLRKHTEKPPYEEAQSCITDASVYVFSGKLFHFWEKGDLKLPSNSEDQIQLEHLFEALLNHREYRDKIYGFMMSLKDYWKDLGTFSDLWTAGRDVLDELIDVEIPFRKIPQTLKDGRKVNLWIDESAKVLLRDETKLPIILEKEGKFVLNPEVVESEEGEKPLLEIYGPNSIGEEVVIGEGSIIYPYNNIGNYWEIGFESILRGMDLYSPTYYYEGERDIARYIQGIHERAIVQTGCISGKKGEWRGQLLPGLQLKNNVVFVVEDEEGNLHLRVIDMNADRELSQRRIRGEIFFSVEKSPSSWR